MSMTSATVVSIEKDSAELAFDDGTHARVPVLFLPEGSAAGSKVMLIKEVQEQIAKDALNELLSQ